MVATEKSLFELTAADLQHPLLVTFAEGTMFRDAAKEILRAGVHGAPVVDAAGRCIGVLSMSDLARWAVNATGPSVAHAKSCYYQDSHRGVGGLESVVCTLPEGKCPFQASKALPDGRVVQECREPHSVLLEWQMVDTESLPHEDVHHYMTGEPVTASLNTPITELARMMVNSVVQRVFVVDADDRPTGVVTSTDIVTALAAAPERVANRSTVYD